MRSDLIKKAASLPKGSSERKKILAALQTEMVPFTSLPEGIQKLCSLSKLKVLKVLKTDGVFDVKFALPTHARLGKEYLALLMKEPSFSKIALSTDGITFGFILS